MRERKEEREERERERRERERERERESSTECMKWKRKYTTISEYARLKMAHSPLHPIAQIQ